MSVSFTDATPRNGNIAPRVIEDIVLSSLDSDSKPVRCAGGVY